MKRVILRVLGAIALLFVPLVLQGSTLTSAFTLYLQTRQTYLLESVLVTASIYGVYLGCAVWWWLKPASTPIVAKAFVVVAQLIGVYILMLEAGGL
ncbi:MAG TPA: hypothetical protein VFO25_00550 [Candidatus Eremiobacteraceae bacterium]|nr:hypothetical protein [Candidatus Eremiobacteraceae bacterium]